MQTIYAGSCRWLTSHRWGSGVDIHYKIRKRMLRTEVNAAILNLFSFWFMSSTCVRAYVRVCLYASARMCV